MSESKAYYVAHGSSVTTKRGIVAWDSPTPCISPKCLGADPDSPEDVAAAKESLVALESRGILTYSAGVVMGPAKLAPPPPAKPTPKNIVGSDKPKTNKSAPPRPASKG